MTIMSHMRMLASNTTLHIGVSPSSSSWISSATLVGMLRMPPLSCRGTVGVERWVVREIQIGHATLVR